MNARGVVGTGSAGLLLVVLLAGCGGGSSTTKDDSSSTTGGSSAWVPPPPSGPTGFGTIGTSVPTGDEVECPSGDFVVDEQVPAGFVGSLTACSTEAGDAVLVKNLSPLLVDVQSASSSTTLRPPVAAGDDLRSQISLQVSSTTSTVIVRVPPGGYVIAETADKRQAQVNVGVDLEAAAQGYTVDLTARYLQSRLSTPSQRLTRSAADCASQAAELWQSTRQDPQTDLDLLMAETAFGPGWTCKKFYADVAEQVGEEAPRNEGVLATELRGLRKDVNASVWDDIIGLVRRAAPLAH